MFTGWGPAPPDTWSLHHCQSLSQLPNVSACLPGIWSHNLLLFFSSPLCVSIFQCPLMSTHCTFVSSLCIVLFRSDSVCQFSSVLKSSVFSHPSVSKCCVRVSAQRLVQSQVCMKDPGHRRAAIFTNRTSAPADGWVSSLHQSSLSLLSIFRYDYIISLQVASTPFDLGDIPDMFQSYNPGPRAVISHKSCHKCINYNNINQYYFKTLSGFKCLKK